MRHIWIWKLTTYPGIGNFYLGSILRKQYFFSFTNNEKALDLATLEPGWIYCFIKVNTNFRFYTFIDLISMSKIGEAEIKAGIQCMYNV